VRCPDGLGREGRLVFETVARLPRIEDADVLTVNRLARLEDEAARLRAVVAEEGENLRRPIQSSRGQLVGEEVYTHPAIGELRRVGAEAHVLCNALGLTPLGRKKLGILVLKDPREPDELDRLREARDRRLAENRAHHAKGEVPIRVDPAESDHVTHWGARGVE
jgi:P27 family predicted phage terminase small subunit